MTALVYIADPLCAWCYGFGPELSELLKNLPELPLHIVVGGLRPYEDQPLDSDQKQKLLTQWQETHDATGLPNNQGIPDGPFIYNTEPACRAVLTARSLATEAAWPVFQAIQQAYFVEGRDLSRVETLAEIAAQTMATAGVNISAAEFQSKMAEEEKVLKTHAEFEQVRKWGVSGFPTLVLERNGELHLVCEGVMQMPRLVEQLQAIVDLQDQPEQNKSPETV